MEKLDIVVIGAGPAGISAGIYCLRAGVNALVLDGGNSALKQAKLIQNYYGLDNISGNELFEKGVNQFKKLGGKVVETNVLKVIKNYETNTFIIKTLERIFEAKAVVLCMGSPKRKTINGLEKFDGANVSYCAICDGFLYRNKTVAVIGSKDFALSECEELEKVVDKIYLISQTPLNVEHLKNVEVVNKNIQEFVGEGFISKIKFTDGTQIDIDGVFVAEGNLSSFELTKQLGLIDKNNFIMVDSNYMTNVTGAFCAGDMIGGLLQISKAVSDGANAGLEAVRYIKIMEMKNE